MRSGSAVRLTGKRFSGGSASPKHNVDSSRGAASSQGGDGMTDVFSESDRSISERRRDEVTPHVARAGWSRS